MNVDSTIRIRDVGVVAVPVTDQDRALDFYVGTLGLGRLESPHTVGGLRHHPHVGLAVDQHPESRAHDPMVVCDQDPDHRILNVTEVPPPGAERTGIDGHVIGP